jgi:hypothetical protein
MSLLRAKFAYDVCHVARVSCKCCAHLPREERAIRDVTFGPLYILVACDWHHSACQIQIWRGIERLPVTCCDKPTCIPLRTYVTSYIINTLCVEKKMVAYAQVLSSISDERSNRAPSSLNTENASG